MYQTRIPMYSTAGRIQDLICVQSFLSVYVICDLKLRVNYVEFKMGQGYSHGGGGW
jgi:hypothetical protein